VCSLQQYSDEDGRKSSDVGAIPCGCPEVVIRIFRILILWILKNIFKSMA
jgi:hypothetical protein